MTNGSEPRQIGEHGRSEKTVLVFGGTGQQGGAVAGALHRAGWFVRAFVRDPGAPAARALAASGVELAAGDFADEGAIQAAMRGAYGVFSVQPSSGQGAAYGISDAQEIRYGNSVADHALRAGVQHLVYTSVAAAGKGPTGMGHFDSKTAIEEHIRGLPLPSTIIRPCSFMELLLLPGMGLDQGAFTFLLRPEQSAQLIAVQDIGKIVAGLFAAPERFAGRTLEIAGDAVTGSDLQASLTRASGRPITYRRFPNDLLAQNAFLGRLAALLDDGRLAGAADIPAIERDFGTMTRFDDWLSGPGRPLLEAAMGATGSTVALR